MGPLEGIRVVELSTGIAGPVAGMLLADYGAEVVKVEPPQGDPARKLAGFAVWNRNKQSVVVDPRTPAGRERLAGLLAGADVCIYADEAALNAALAEAKIANPGLVRLAMPPYVGPLGESGNGSGDGCAPWAGGAESHELLAALAGASSRQASFDGGPIHLVYPFAFYEQGIWAAACAVSALIERQTSAQGQTVTVAGIHGVLACMPGSFTLDPNEAPLPTNVGAGGRHPCYSTFKCGDGKWLFMAALTPKFQANAFKILGVGNLFADPRIDNNPRALVLPENRPWVRALLEAAFATRSRDEWLEALEIGDCPAGPMYDREVWLDHPQVVENDLRVEIDDPERGHVMMPGICIGLGKTPGKVRTPAPTLGQHDATAGKWEPAPTPSPSPAGGRGENEDANGSTPARTGEGSSVGPLAGVRVLDLGTILAGPYAGNLLAGLGADVVKVEAPAGDAFRETGFVYNRGMRGLAIDLSRPSGQHAFHRLAKTVDIVIDNSRGGVAQRLRFDYATLAEANPRIITLSIAGFGERGPFNHKPAFDPVLQAMSGMMTAQGGDSDPGFYTIPVNDVAAAVTTVLGVCLALYHRGQSGEGQRTWTSLVASSLTMQSGELVRYEHRPPAVRGGRDFAGPSPAEHFYPVEDGWVRVQAPSLAALGEALGLAGVGKLDEQDATAIADALAASRRDEVLARLTQAGIPAAAARHTAEVVRDPAVQAIELLEEHHFPDGRAYLVPHRYARFSRTEQASISDAPGVGEHSRAVLGEAGLSEEEIAALIEERVVIQGEPFILRELINYR